MRKPRNNKLAMLLVFVLVAAIVAALLLPSGQKDILDAGENIMKDEEILAIASENDAVKDFSANNPGYSAKVTALPPDNLSGLSREYPVIYPNANITLYQIDYSSGSRGLLVIVNPDVGVLRTFPVVGVRIG